MLLRKLLDPEETARRRKLRARIVRRNRIQREIAQGQEPKWRRIPKPKELTVNDYGWNPLEDGTALLAEQKRVERDGNALAFLLKGAQSTETYGSSTVFKGERLRSPQVLLGASDVPARFASRTTAAEPQELQPRATSGAPNTLALTNMTKLPNPVKGTANVSTRPRNERLCGRWRDVFQLLMIQRHEDVLRKDPNRPWRQERLGLLLFDRKRYKEASEHLVQAIKLGVTRSICWRRLAQCHWFEYNLSQDWDALWDAKAAFEQALNHLEMACNPYVLFDYARVLEALGSYDGALNACASLLSTFPKFALITQVKLRFIVLQRHQLHVFGGAMASGDKERAVSKCLEITKTLLLDKAVSENAQYLLVLYLHIRLNELLHETIDHRGEGSGIVARSAKASADQATEELFKAVVARKLLTVVPGVAWKVWWSQSETYLQWADHFQAMNENVAAADALARALELMETPAVPVKIKAKKVEDPNALAKKIALYLSMAMNYYQSNQMERAIRAMETIFQLNPYLNTVRQSLVEWFPAKWKERIELEDASQVQIARTLRGLWGRAKALKRRCEVEAILESKYLSNPFNPFYRRSVLHYSLKAKYAPLFAAQYLAAKRIQQAARKYLSYARIRWVFQARKDKEIYDLRAKYNTRKYRYNRNVRFQLSRLVPQEFDSLFRREDRAAALMQRWFRGERVRKEHRARKAEVRAVREREEDAVRRIQRAYRDFAQRTRALSLVRADQLLFETHRRLQLARERLARKFQRLYFQWKNRLVLATRLHLERLQLRKLESTRQSSAGKIQRTWRRFIARVRGGSRGTEAAILLDQLKRGHEQLMAVEDEANRQRFPGMDASARKIQAIYRGKRIRASLANITRQVVPPRPGEIQLLLEACERRHTTGAAPRVVLAKLDSLQEKRALFDFPVIVIKPHTSDSELPMTHLVSAIKHSSMLDTLVIVGGDLRGSRAVSLFESLQFCKKIKRFALGGVSVLPRRQSRGSEPSVPEDEEDSDEDSEDEETEQSPMKTLSTTLRTQNFLLEELLLEGNDLLRHKHDGWLLATTIGDYFHGRYGKLRVLAAQRMQLSDESIGLFGDALAINTVLQRLNLSDNEIRDAGTKAIAKGLAANKNLLYLNLADNSIGSSGAKELFSCLQTSNHTLKTLILTNNMVMNDAVSALFGMLQTNAVVDEIDLRGNLIHKDHVVEIESLLKERLTTDNEELRLFLARRRLSGGEVRRATMLSPLRRKGSTRKNRAPAMSPQKWIKTHRAENAQSYELLQSPCALFKQPAVSPAVLLVGSTTSTKKRQKPMHQYNGNGETRLPTLALSPSKASTSVHRKYR